MKELKRNIDLSWLECSLDEYENKLTDELQRVINYRRETKQTKKDMERAARPKIGLSPEDKHKCLRMRIEGKKVKDIAKEVNRKSGSMSLIITSTLRTYSQNDPERPPWPSGRSYRRMFDTEGNKTPEYIEYQKAWEPWHEWSKKWELETLMKNPKESIKMLDQFIIDNPKAVEDTRVHVGPSKFKG